MEDNTNYGLLAYDKAEHLEKELDTLRRNSANGLSARVDNLETVQVKMNSSITAVENKQTEQQKDIESLNASVLTNSSTIDEMQTAQQEQDIVITSLEGAVNTHTEQIADLQTNMTKNTTTIAEHYSELTESINEANNNIDTLETKNTAQDEAISSLNEDVAQLEISCENSYNMANTVSSNLSAMQTQVNTLQTTVSQNTQNIQALQNSQGGGSAIPTTASEVLDTYYQNTNGCELLQPYTSVSKDYPKLDFYARYFGYLKGNLTISFKGVTTASSVSAEITLFADNVEKEVKTLTLANDATASITFDINLPFKRGLHKIYVHTQTTTVNGEDNLAIISYNYSFPHAHIECLTTPMKYYVGLGSTTEVLGVSDGYSGRYVWRNSRLHDPFADDFKEVVHAGTYDIVGEVVSIGVYLHPTNGLYVNPNIIARTHDTNTYQFYSDFTGGSNYTYPITLAKRPKAIDCVSARYRPGSYLEGRLNLVYMDDDGYLKLEGFMRDGTLYKMEYPTITDKAYRIVHTRTYSGNLINLIDFIIETEDGTLVHYNFQGTGAYEEPTAIYRQELGYGRDPILTWDKTLGRYVLLYKKRGGIYRKEFTLDTTNGTYEIISDTYLCDGDYAYYFDKDVSYAFAYDNKFMRVPQNNPITY